MVTYQVEMSESGTSERDYSTSCGAKGAFVRGASGFPTNAVRNDNSKVSRQAFPDWMSFLPEGCEEMSHMILTAKLETQVGVQSASNAGCLWVSIR
eukprot:1705914-Amphidinium_carterae.1